MTEKTLELANKLRHNIRKIENILKGEIPLQLIVTHAREQCNLIGYLSEEKVKSLKEEVRACLEKELESMRKEFTEL